MGKQQMPVLPFYVRDYLAATRGMSLAERGAYTDVLFFSWDNGPLPDDLMKIARLLGVMKDELPALKAVLAAKFVRRKGCLINERLEAERANVAERMRRQAEKSSRGGIAKRQRYASASGNATGSANGTATGTNQAVPNACHPELLTPSSESEAKPSEEGAPSPLPAVAGSGAPISEEIRREIWRLYDDGLAPARIASRIREDRGKEYGFCSTPLVSRLLAEPRPLEAA